MAGIYKITNKINGHSYIGKTKTTFKRRWYHHTWSLNKGISECLILQKAWNKYGSASFEFESIVEGDFSKVELSKLEIIFIKLYGYYNILISSPSHEFKQDTLKKKSDSLKAIWADPEKGKALRESRIKARVNEHWDKYEEVKTFWLDKSNGRGGCKHPGHVKITQVFGIPRGTAKRIIKEIKSESNLVITEGYNKEEIYKYWSNPLNAQQAKYKHPGVRVLAKVFKISEYEAKQLVSEFKNNIIFKK